MPLSEFHPAITKGKSECMPNCSSDPSYMHDEFVKLLWDNGPIVTQGQSNRPRKSSFYNALSPHGNRAQEMDSKDNSFPKVGHFRAIESKVNNFPLPGSSAGIGINAQDDDDVPWIHYSIEDSLHNDYCSDFLNDCSGVNLNFINSQQNNVPTIRSSCLDQAVRDSHNVEQGHASEPCRIRTSQLFQLPPQFHSLDPSTKSSSTDLGIGSNIKAHQESGGIGAMNFSHFLRPVALARANLQGIGRLESNNKAKFAMSSKPGESSVIESTSGLKSALGTQDQLSSVQPGVDLRSSAMPPHEVILVKQPEPIYEGDISKKNSNHNTTKNCSTSPERRQSSSFATSVTLGRNETDKGNEAVVASCSVCSDSSAGAASNDHKRREKTEHHEVDESGYQSEDLEDESVGLKKPASVRGKSSKRSRAAEVHNLSERRRRDRINEKMRALQELIPNCNKTDKASMLDEAIEYLKSLQMQVQIMSMGGGLCMHPMMMQHIRAPMMAHFSPMGIGMGMGVGLGYGMGMYDMNSSPGCSLIPVPPIQGAQFPCPPIPGLPGLHRVPGSANVRMSGIPEQGLRVPMPHRPPSASLSGAGNNPVAAMSLKDLQQQNTNLEKTQKSCTGDSQIRTSSQAAKECFEDSSAVQLSDQPSHNSH